MSEVCHISSVLLTVRPDEIDRVSAAVGEFEAAEVALADQSGKIIVTMETANERHIADALNAMAVMPGVVSAALVYHEIDYGPDGAGNQPASGNQEEGDHGSLTS